MKAEEFFTDAEILAVLGKVKKEMERPDLTDETTQRRRIAKADFFNMSNLDLSTFIEA